MGLFKRTSFGSTKFKGQYLFQNFGYGLYNQEVPRTLEEQLATLAMVGGRNVWAIRGALVNQYGYAQNYQLDEGEYVKIVPTISSSSQSLPIISTAETVYRYTNYDGLKKYKTSLPTLTNPITTYSGTNLYIYNSDGTFYTYGSRYNGDNDNSPFESIVTLVADEFVRVDDNVLKVEIDVENLPYFWTDKKLALEQFDGDQTYDYYDLVVNRVYLERGIEDLPDKYYVDVRFDGKTPEHRTSDVVAGNKIGEMTLQTADSATEFVYIPEQGSPDPQVTLIPKLMAVVLNRLWIVNNDNTIYYSAVGNMTNFEQANGAGFFKGFYNDTSDVLTIEEYYSGALITKQNGMYHVKLTTKDYSFEGVAYGTESNYLTINKINNIPQKYPGDHVIIGDEVIAYDAVSGNLVQAAYINYFQNLQQGAILLHGSEIDSQGLGLHSAVNRVLGYNYQEEVLIVYYGDMLYQSLVITRGLSIYPREINKDLVDCTMFAQGLLCFTTDGLILEDFKRGTVIPEITSVVEFEPICLRGSKLLSGTIIEFTELNDVNFNISTSNAGYSSQDIIPSSQNRSDEESVPLMLYSNSSNPRILNDTVAGEAKWVYQKSDVTRVAAPLSGRDGLTLRMEFPKNTAFTLCAINLPDLSRGE